MCEQNPDENWRGVGVSSWERRLQAFEQCQDCGEYRARILDPHEIRVVEGQPQYGDSHTDTESDPESEIDWSRRPGGVYGSPSETRGDGPMDQSWGGDNESDEDRDSDQDEDDSGDGWLIE